MILDACFEIPKLEDSILNFQMLFDVRNMELKMSQLIRRECFPSVALKVEDTVLIWMLTPADKKESIYMQNVTIRKSCLLFICLGLHTN